MIPICSACRNPGIRSERYDAYYCASCNIWLEGGCGDLECEFCSNRPINPWDVK